MFILLCICRKAKAVLFIILFLSKWFSYVINVITIAFMFKLLIIVKVL